ncbi:type IV toxin-antitoxin system AbiEi family antitoxin domain-containing protein [Terracoccus luteus]|uniref:Uncharacterized protein n=1 Tax=Terracoccus luteus TaxID=53356 RepID=A0A839PXC1_9MICO|nr:type IV toxin-antitoxin system AbiEi family antitoxin domain-containing protein [Terracoccus luteus]MBB2985051.1 hypothetical protein [Terracoccus luteus]MCP2170703.1 hypothetical protein [Terracoccus luteus]
MDRRLLSRIEGQNGLVTKVQAIEGGLTAKAVRCKVESGRWVRMHPGVYLTTPGRDDWETRALAVLLHLGVPSALCGRSAAYLWGLVPSPGREIEVVVGSTRNPDPVPGVQVRRSRHAVRRTHETAWPHRTDAENTVLDLAHGQSVDVMVGHLAKALQLRLTTARTLRAALADRPTQPSRSLLLEIVGDLDGGVESSAERRYVQDVETAHGLPVGRRQAPAPGGSRRDNL